MKKKGLIKLAACTLVLSMALSLGACSDSSKDDDTDKKTEVNNTVDDDDDDDDSSSGKFASMEDYVASDEVQAEIEASKSALEGQGETIDIRGEGNKLIYSYKYETIVKQEGMEETLETEAAKQESLFTSTATSLKSLVDVDNPVVVIEYIDANGEMIFTKEYPAE